MCSTTKDPLEVGGTRASWAGNREVDFGQVYGMATYAGGRAVMRRSR